MTDYTKLRKSLKHLERQFANYRGAKDRAALTDLDREAIAESTVQRFETCYDTLWKCLKRHLTEKLGIPEVPNSPKPILRLANENGLLGSSVERWMDYADARVSTAHDYSGSKAGECLDLMEDFVADAIAAYKTMAGETWA